MSIDEFFILGGFKETDVYFSDDTQTDINKQLNEINTARQMECFIDLLDFLFCKSRIHLGKSPEK